MVPELGHFWALEVIRGVHHVAAAEGLTGPRLEALLAEARGSEES